MEFSPGLLHKGYKVGTIHHIEGADKEDMGKNIPKIYVAFDNRQVDHQAYVIEFEGKINNQPIAILIDVVASHSYIEFELVKRFHF